MASSTTDSLRQWLDTFLQEPTFLAQYPYYAAILGKLCPVADPSVQRMAVSFQSGQFFLHINVESFLGEPQFLRGVLLHEVHHIALGHLTHPKFGDAAEPELMDLAIEMSANEYIQEPLPPAILWQAYAKYGIRAGQSTLERYDKLVEAVRTSGSWPRPVPQPGGPPPGHPSERVDEHRFLRAGHALPGGLPRTQQLLTDAAASAPAHVGPKGSPLLVAGTSPGGLLEQLGLTSEAPQAVVDWKRALQSFLAETRVPHPTYARPSRRFPDRVGQVPGRSYTTAFRKHPRLLVALDTSLSMTAPELREVAAQLNILQELAHITIVECDVDITRMYPFAGSIPSISGRGGTDLRPVFSKECLGRAKPDGVIYFTDGDGPFPETHPGIKTLWVLTKPFDFKCPWGERAHLDLGRKPPPPKADPFGRAADKSTKP